MAGKLIHESGTDGEHGVRPPPTPYIIGPGVGSVGMLPPIYLPFTPFRATILRAVETSSGKVKLILKYYYPKL